MHNIIERQKGCLAALDSAPFLRHKDYIQAMSIVRKKPYYLEQELAAGSRKAARDVGIMPAGAIGTGVWAVAAGDLENCSKGVILWLGEPKKCLL